MVNLSKGNFTDTNSNPDNRFVINETDSLSHLLDEKNNLINNEKNDLKNDIEYVQYQSNSVVNDNEYLHER